MINLPQANIPQIRRLLNNIFDDPGLDAFCQDYFLNVYKRFSRGMRHDEKINLLLDECLHLPTGFDKLLEAVLSEYEANDSQRAELKSLIEAIEALPREITISEDGRIIPDDETLHAPLPEFDPSVLENLDKPTGAVKLRSKFYVERQADIVLRREVVQIGTTVTIHAPRQTGKSSLLMRGVQHARQHGAKAVVLNLQSFGADRLAAPDIFLRELAELIVRKLQLDVSEIEKLWQTNLGPQNKLTYLIEDYILPEIRTSFILALDEVDRLLQISHYKDFFAMLRAWHEKRALYEEWDRLNIVMVISTEPYTLIPADSLQSPFNVGTIIYLEDFNETQVRDLNERHGSPVEASEFPELMDLLAGHPYLTRQALYTLVTEQQTWANLSQLSSSEQGPFREHLWHYYSLVRADQRLKTALKEVIRYNRCSDEIALIRLLRVGLIKGRGDVHICRCGLYSRYFEKKL